MNLSTTSTENDPGFVRVAGAVHENKGAALLENDRTSARFYSVNGHAVFGVPSPDHFTARPLLRRDLRPLRRAEWRSERRWWLTDLPIDVLGVGACMAGVWLAAVLL